VSVSLLAPLGLAALVALALPLLIHLIRRIELTTTEFAALRWISERVQPRRRLRFERPWLLLLRLALLALVALLLARPVFDASAPMTSSRIYVAPGADRSAARAAITAPDADWRWLAPGFPRFDVDAVNDAVPFASLLREADADQPRDAHLVVVVPEQLAGLDGERPRLSHALDWQVVAGRMPDAVPTPAPPVTLAVRYTPAMQASVAYLRAAVAAWNVREPDRYRLDAQPSTAPISDDARWLAWLADSPPPAEISAWIEHGGIALLANDAHAEGDPLWRDASGGILARSATAGRGRVIAVRGALTPADLPGLLEADFPQRLHDAMSDAAPLPGRADALAIKPLDALAGATVSASVPNASQPFDPWLVLAIAALFALERIVATRARTETRA
jgi:hypothetical protein